MVRLLQEFDSCFFDWWNKIAIKDEIDAMLPANCLHPTVDSMEKEITSETRDTIRQFIIMN